jgi:hypothetical protein
MKNNLKKLKLNKIEDNLSSSRFSDFSIFMIYPHKLQMLVFKNFTNSYPNFLTI